ncbi:hypothetical protein JCM19237_6604 [Photobacterium aphoticum]|uniref:Uncharacterized protein n=1 Tax=Photobacterium aphoticum TaxID=754436 RepID=A0A090QKN3_9GAMM|nr:hypothetical protein JCM19237_6604 [Photobacterium aphoticum]
MAILAVVMAFVTLALSKVIASLIHKGEALEKEELANSDKPAAQH